MLVGHRLLKFSFLVPFIGHGAAGQITAQGMGNTLTGIVEFIGAGIFINNSQKDVLFTFVITKITGDRTTIGKTCLNAFMAIADTHVRPVFSKNVHPVTASRVVNIKEETIVQFKRGLLGVYGSA
jgi:hypothetical protein